jgi:hypothetical protein
MKKFTEIEQFRNVIRQVKDSHDYAGKNDDGKAIFNHTTPYPTMKFRGTVKLHGSNSSIVKYADGTYKFQSRESELSLTEDNYNFMNEMIKKDYQKLFDNIQFNEYCAIYGEWCGKGIQKKVAISQLPKMFVIFAIKIDGLYKDMSNFAHIKNEDQLIFNILQFPNFEIDINFNRPELSINILSELTNNVEKECPVGKYFDVSGTGEGIVWEHINDNKRYIFKVKGEKHQVSKVKTLTTVDIEEIENIKSFVDYAVTENRLTQGIDKMRELNIPIIDKSTADYLKWVYNDVIKEESDTIEKNNINIKKIGKAISAKARIFWLNYLNTNFDE